MPFTLSRLRLRRHVLRRSGPAGVPPRLRRDVGLPESGGPDLARHLRYTNLW